MQIILHISQLVVPLHPKTIGLWCNGNTADSGPAFPGSSPGSPTKQNRVDTNVSALSLFIPHHTTHIRNERTKATRICSGAGCRQDNNTRRPVRIFAVNRLDTFARLSVSLRQISKILEAAKLHSSGGDKPPLRRNRRSFRVGAENNQHFAYCKQTFLIKVLFFARLFVSLRCGKMEKLSDGKLFRDISQGAFCCNGH